jgi:hypothetical protein
MVFIVAILFGEQCKGKQDEVVLHTAEHVSGFPVSILAWKCAVF